MYRRLNHIRAWRTRRHERRDEKLIALSNKDKKYIRDVQGQLDNANALVGMGEHAWARHAGEEGHKH
jgi:hypothetical protein